MGGGGPLGGGIDGGIALACSIGRVGLRIDKNGRDDLYCLGGVTATVIDADVCECNILQSI